jgi:hypothetical protein
MMTRNEVEAMILSDLAALCTKLAENPTVPEELRGQMAAFVEEYDLLLSNGSGTRREHFAAEHLLIRIARFLPIYRRSWMQRSNPNDACKLHQMSFKPVRIPLLAQLLLLALTIPLSACSKSDKPSVRVFATPDDASDALATAVKSGDQIALRVIFGPDAKEVLSSGDAVQDRNDDKAFTAHYEVRHRWRNLEDGTQILLVGADDIPFPIPLSGNSSGLWFFDTAAGKKHILNHRISRNEEATIAACHAIDDAQAVYFSQLHDGGTTKQYAMKFISDPGKQNGLYWTSGDGQLESPLGPLLAFATSEGFSVKPDSHSPFHGYYFRMLKGQTDKAKGGAKQYVVDGKMVGGFAFVAYPAEYGKSGVLTFMANQEGVLLQKDLGEATTEKATGMSEFDPDRGWHPVTPAP